VPAILAIFALSCTFLTSFGQAQNTAPTQKAAPAQLTGPILEAKFAANLSTKNAKPGDAVAAKTLKQFELKDGTDIPKGSRIVGKVGSVQSKKTGDGKSLLTFRLDQIEIKGGATVPIHGLVVAIGPSLAPKEILGANSVLTRNATGLSDGIDPNAGIGSAGAKDEDDIPLGSRLEGVSLGRHMDADWTTALLGIHQDIDLDSDVLIKVLLR
jgi:hypothetical protein